MLRGGGRLAFAVDFSFEDDDGASLEVVLLVF